MIFSDKLNHASIIDGMRLSDAKYFRYPHNNTEALEKLLIRERHNFNNAVIVTESVFSMDGDIADLPDIALLSLETPKCWHWSLYASGKVYDPEYGVLDDFPVSNRKYYWEIKSAGTV